ncbi:MAG: LacI family DNA-binding transcriptional regulator [Opitutae bacterium]|nr:LacI family DNA-binding transcriptional regulator [Opitutae bacterium]
MSAPTLKQVAELAGVSKATVSLALRNDVRITLPVREKVQAAARKLDYRPNPLLAVHMAHLRTVQPPQWRATIGFLAQLEKRQWHEDRYRPANLAYAGATERANALGYTLEIFWLGQPGMTGARMSRILTSRGVPGFVVAPWPRPGLGERLGLAWENFAAATIGYTLWEPDIHRACHDNFSTMGLAFSELLRRGYRRIGFATAAEDDDRVNHQWLARFLVGQTSLPPKGRVPPLLTREWNAEIFLRWMKSARPDAIITTRGAIVTQWLGKARIRVPEKVGVVTVYWRPDAPHCSGFYQNFELLGAAAIDLVVAQLHRNERGLPAVPKVMLMPGAWREGSTLRPPPAAPPKTA